MLRLIPYSLKTPLLQRAFSCTECRGGYSEQVAKFPFAHGGCANVGRMMMLPSVVMMLRFMAMLGYGVTLPNDAFSLLPNIVRSLSSFCVVIFA